MTKDELNEKLKPLATGLNNSLSSKQHVFNEHLDTIIDCKNMGIGNKIIVDSINSHIDDDEKITIVYFKNLLFRSGYKRKKSDKSAKESASKESTMNSDSSDASGRKFGNFERPEEKIFKHNPKSDDDLFTKG